MHFTGQCLKLILIIKNYISSNTDSQGQSTSSNTDNVIDSQTQPPSLNVQNQLSPSTLVNKIITKKRNIIKLTFQQSW